MRRRGSRLRTAAPLSSLYTGLTAQYKLNEALGSTVIVDERGYSNGTRLSGTLGVAGKFGTAYRTNGTEYIDTNTKTLIGGRSAFTFACWVKNNDANSADLFGSFGGIRSTNIRQDTNNRWIFDLYDAAGVYKNIVFSSPDLININWREQGVYKLLIITYDGATVRCWVNNTEAQSGFALTGAVRVGSDNEKIGQHRSGQYSYRDIDEMIFWDRALTTDERENLYNNGSGIIL